MNRQELIITKFRHFVQLFYKLILPLVTIIGMLIVSPSIDRFYFMESPTIDLIARIWICISFSYGYVFLEKYSGALRMLGSPEQGGYSTKETRYFFVLIVAIVLGLSIGFVTWWLMGVFFSNLVILNALIGIVNGLIFAIPVGVPQIIIHTEG